MPATRTTTTETLTISPSSRPRRVGVIAAGLIVFAAVLTPWLLSTSSQTEPGPIAPTWAAAPPQAAPGHASAVRSYAPNIEPLAAYALFCQNNPTLCAPPATTTVASIGYLRFCWNSPSLCALPKRN